MSAENSPLQGGLHIVTYDVRGTFVDTGEHKDYRQTGIVTQTHQLIGGFALMDPEARLAVTQTGVEHPSARYLQTPEGLTVLAQGIDSRFGDYLRDPVTGGKNKTLVTDYYERRVHDPTNPVYRSLASQYAEAVRRADMPNLLLQNPNPIVSLLKAEEYGFLDDLTCGQLNVTGVVHDVEGYEERLGYIQEAFGRTRMDLKLIAVSEFVHRQLIAMGMPAERITKVPNGLDIQRFADRLERARGQQVFDNIAERNGLPRDSKMILIPARRVAHKGHLDVIEAIKTLRDEGKLDDMYVACTGCHMLNTQGLDFEGVIQKAIAEAGLQDRVFCLDDLTDDETAACYDAAFASVLASTEPEGFAYANIKAMLAETPVITTRLGGPLDYIEDGVTGLFVEPRSPQLIADALDLLNRDPELYARIAGQGHAKAAEYTVESMVEGYVAAIASGGSRLPIRIHTRRIFEKLGEGMHTEVYGHVPDNGYVVQTFRPEHALSRDALGLEYDYLVEAYAAMPGLVPKQRLTTSDAFLPLERAALVKERVYSDPTMGTLLNVAAPDLAPKTLAQLRQFVDITKTLFTQVLSNPDLAGLGSRVPDIIDPEFSNLVIDNRDNLRLVDTNKLISTKHLNGLTEAGAKLDVSNRRIHGLLLRRLMFIESKFFGRTAKQLRADSFYAQYLSSEGFDQLFEQSAAVGEPIVGAQFGLAA